MTPETHTDHAGKLSGWQAFCAAARTMSATNDNQPVTESKSEEETRDAQRNN